MKGLWVALLEDDRVWGFKWVFAYGDLGISSWYFNHFGSIVLHLSTVCVET